MAKLSVTPARRVAFEILRKVESGEFSSTLLASNEPRLRPTDRALCHELVMGVLRWQLYLDRIVEHHSNKEIGSLDPGVRIALRLGLYQLRFLTRIPASAAVNESVNLVRWAGLNSARTFVNAVLRAFTREREYDPATGVVDPFERLSIQTSHPYWLIVRWAKTFGLEETEVFARANNQMPPTVFRVVRTRAHESEILDKLRAAGAEIEASKIAVRAWRVSGATVLLRELTAQGQIYLQDEASQLVAQKLNLQPGERALDLCAAPGGKTTLIADWAGNQALVVAADLSANRMQLVRRASVLQHLTTIHLVLVDARQQLPFGEDSFDRVLVDAPCSGTGTLRRNPEIRWRISTEDISHLSARQKQLLRNAANVVKAGGKLIYSTCSVEREENEEVIEDFLKGDSRFRQVPVGVGSALIRRTWPQREGCDGFFIAAFERTTQV